MYSYYIQSFSIFDLVVQTLHFNVAMIVKSRCFQCCIVAMLLCIALHCITLNCFALHCIVLQQVEESGRSVADNGRAVGAGSLGSGEL